MYFNRAHANSQFISDCLAGLARRQRIKYLTLTVAQLRHSPHGIQILRHAVFWTGVTQCTVHGKAKCTLVRRPLKYVESPLLHHGDCHLDLVGVD